MSLDAQIRTLIAQAVLDAASKVKGSKECMSAEEAREFLGLTAAEFRKRRHLIPRREESERKSYYLREDLLTYLRGLPCVPESDYASDYLQGISGSYGPGSGRRTA